MFNRKDGPPQDESAATPQVSFGDPTVYEVMNSASEWERVEGHTFQIVDGCLLVSRGVFIHESCAREAISTVPAMIYAPGEWKRCKTDYRGYTPKSALSLI